MTERDTLLREIEAAAADLGIATTTASALTGQGGHFYKRLGDGKRAFPETIEAARETLRKKVRERKAAKLACDTSPANAPTPDQARKHATVRSHKCNSAPGDAA